MAQSSRQVRIFFALWPGARMRARFAEIAARIPLERPARRVPDYNLHLTLHFVGNVAPQAADCMRRQARRVTGDAFTLAIDSCGHFGGAGVGWLGCSEIPDALLRLQRELGASLQVCGYTPEARTYRPHVTVVRKLKRAPAIAAFEALSWEVDSFALVESRATDNGVKYEVVETYPIA